MFSHVEAHLLPCRLNHLMKIRDFFFSYFSRNIIKILLLTLPAFLFIISWHISSVYLYLPLITPLKRKKEKKKEKKGNN